MSNAKIRARRRRRAAATSITEARHHHNELVAMIAQYGGFSVCYARFLEGSYLPPRLRTFVKAMTFGDRMMRPMSISSTTEGAPRGHHFIRFHRVSP
jgi:hypothetical protein